MENKKKKIYTSWWCAGKITTILLLNVYSAVNLQGKGFVLSRLNDSEVLLYKDLLTSLTCFVFSQQTEYFYSLFFIKEKIAAFQSQ